jgi:N-acetyl-anhydromuramyl-L-alanine amidase AmpD
MDPGGYDAYRVERRFSPMAQSDWKDSAAAVTDLKTPNRYGLRASVLTPEQVERVRGGGWDLPLLQSVVDQFVIHFDAGGTSRTCFQTLQDDRDLSVHFMLDLDGTIYQTLDVKERAWQATKANSRSVGVEIANIGAYGRTQKKTLVDWYHTNSAGFTVLSIPPHAGASPERTPNFFGGPVRRAALIGEVQGQQLTQYDYTPQQYHALARLTATLCTVLPKIRCDYPRDAQGRLVTHALSDAEYDAYRGVLGHYHVQTDKIDPGPALQWDYVIGEARRLMRVPPLKQDVAGRRMTGLPTLLQDNFVTAP